MTNATPEGPLPQPYRDVVDIATEDVGDLISFARNVLVLINSPKIVGCQQHEPHRGLARQIKQTKSMVGFHLLPWHEINLQITKPAEIADGEPHEARITGRRARHFVRKFMRVRLGRLEYVSARWRGDPALGIHQADYRVGA
jgi:hypothetical protein